MSDEIPTDGPSQRQQPPAPPTVSPDGRFWWDGTTWKPMPEDPARPAPGPSMAGQVAPAPAATAPEKQGLWRRIGWAGLIAAVLAVFAIAHAVQANHEAATRQSIADAPLDTFEPEDMTCPYLADEAVRISKKHSGLAPRMLDVRTVEIAADYRQTYVPPTGAAESKVLVCKGIGVFDTGARVPVKITGSVDADLTMWVYYKAY